jgi:hypothetical protein
MTSRSAPADKLARLQTLDEDPINEDATSPQA